MGTWMLIPMEWDLAQLLSNGKNLAMTLGGALLGLLGVVAIIVAAVRAFGKLTSEQSRASWGKIIGIFMLGGVMLAGGIALFVQVATGLKDTVDDLGGGLMLPFLGLF